MDAGKLIQDILQAGERAKSVVPCYMGKPYTATLVKLNGIKNKNLINIGQVIKLP